MSVATAASTGAIVGANSVSASAGLPAGLSAPTALNNIINQSGLSATYVSGVTDFSSFVATTTASYSCNGGCYPELGGVATDANGGFGSITFSFASPVTLAGIVVWNEAGSASIESFSLNGVAGVFRMPANSQDFPQPAEVFAFSSITVSTLTLNILSNDGYSGGTILNEVAFDSAGGVPEPATWATLILGLGAVGVAMRRRHIAIAASVPRTGLTRR